MGSINYAQWINTRQLARPRTGPDHWARFCTTEAVRWAIKKQTLKMLLCELLVHHLYHRLNDYFTSSSVSNYVRFDFRSCSWEFVADISTTLAL